MNTNNSTEAVMNPLKFETPIQAGDTFHKCDMHVGEFDLFSLKQQAIDKGYRQALAVKKTSNTCKNGGIDSETVAHSILTLLKCKRYRRGPSRYILKAESFLIKQIVTAIEKETPIELILSFFGAKVRNPLKTFANQGTEVDISEAASLLRFYEITIAISNLYAPGCIIKIACDGNKYSDAIGFDLSEGQGYYENLCKLANYLDISNQVQLFDESIHYPDGYLEKNATELIRVKDSYTQNTDPQLVEFITRLRTSMIFSIPIDDHVSFETILLALSFNTPDNIIKKQNNEAYNLRKYLCNEATERSLKYVAIYNTIKELGVISGVAPDALRATVHPKLGQIGLYATNKCSVRAFPHHGQGISKTMCLHPKIDDLRVCYKADISRNSGGLVGLALPSDTYPFSNGKHPFTFINETKL